MAGYSSFGGFAAKFCRLNRIPPKQFREFWYASVEAAYVGRKEAKIRHIARLLDEPLALVRTVFGTTGMGWGHFSLGQKDSVWHGNLAYCPLCLAEGYHSHFHETRWLKQCPVHCVGLATETSQDRLGSKPDREVGKLILLFDAKAADWGTADGQWGVKGSAKKPRVFQHFLCWYHATTRLLAEWSRGCLGIFGHNNLDSRFNATYELQHLGLLMGRVHCLSPIPKQTGGIFAARPMNSQPDIRFFHEKVASEFRSLQAIFPSNILFYLYKLSCFVAGNPSLFQDAAATAINQFKSHHPHQQCRCVWGKHPNDGWQRFQPGTVQDFWAYHCPYDLAIMEMGSDWLGFLQTHLPERNQPVDNYIGLARAAEAKGFVSVVHYFAGGAGQSYGTGAAPILKFHWSSEMARLVETVLVENVLSHTCELVQWLSGIEAGANPGCRNYLPPNLYLFEHVGSGLRLEVWPAVGITP